MLKTLPRMKLSREEEVFLRHWMYDEVHYQDGQGLAKKLQLQHRVAPADLAIIIAAAIPNLAEQKAAGVGAPPAEALQWPWSNDRIQSRLSEAKAILAERRGP